MRKIGAIIATLICVATPTYASNCYTMTSFGDSSANTSYTNNSTTHNGQDTWTNGTYFLFYNGSNSWYLHTTLSDAASVNYYNTGTDPTTATWNYQHFGPAGAVNLTTCASTASSTGLTTDIGTQMGLAILIVIQMVYFIVYISRNMFSKKPWHSS